MGSKYTPTCKIHTHTNLYKDETLNTKALFFIKSQYRKFLFHTIHCTMKSYPGDCGECTKDREGPCPLCSECFRLEVTLFIATRLNMYTKLQDVFCFVFFFFFHQCSLLHNICLVFYMNRINKIKQSIHLFWHYCTKKPKIKCYVYMYVFIYIVYVYS